MYIDQTVQRSLQRFLQKPGAEGISPSDFIAHAIDVAHSNDARNVSGMILDSHELSIMETVLDLAMASALTTTDWLAIHHIAEMVGLEDGDDDIAVRSVLG